MHDTDVLIVGAGPTGLVLALWLAKQGVRVRIIDKTSQPGTTSRALAVHARILELYRQLDLTDEVVASGLACAGANLWVKGEKKARIDLGGGGEKITPYPFLHIFPQDEHEKLLIARLERLGVKVEREAELVDFDDDGSGVQARARHANAEETISARFLAGCDGAHSRVREELGTDFPGGTYSHTFYVADVEASGPAMNRELNVDLDDADFLALFPLKGEGHARLIGALRDDHRADSGELTFADVSERPIEHMKLEIRKLHWFSTYRVHHRVAGHFVKGRVFLAGDAAHIHSPVGGQGMNTGIGDAINLAWKIKAFIAGQAPYELLSSYEAERIGFARQLVASTDRAFTFVTADSAWANFVRTRIAPVVLPPLVAIDAVRQWMFETVSQCAISYRDGPQAGGAAGSVHGGDRLPWIDVAGRDNYATFCEINWQVHVYGTARHALKDWCISNRVPLHEFEWNEAYGAVGLACDAMYLMRPDTYVFHADPSGLPDETSQFLATRQMTIAPATS